MKFLFNPFRLIKDNRPKNLNSGVSFWGPLVRYCVVSSSGICVTIYVDESMTDLL